MQIIPDKTILAIAGLVEIAKTPRIPQKILAARLDTQPRYLETTLQACVHQGILIGARGPKGGYLLKKSAHLITVAQIVRLCDGLSTAQHIRGEAASVNAVISAFCPAGDRFFDELENLTIADLCSRADALPIKQAAE